MRPKSIYERVGIQISMPENLKKFEAADLVLREILLRDGNGSFRTAFMPAVLPIPEVYAGKL